MRVAAIDIGTNTALMLIAEGGHGSLRVVRDEHSIPRLGEDVDKIKSIRERAIQRLDEVLARYQKLIEESSVDKVDAVGTSALRDATNSQEVRDHIHKTYGIPIRLVTGDEEAQLTYVGALSGFPISLGLTGVIDIGGGSTEIALGSGDKYHIGSSMDIGAVRLTERTRSRGERELLIRKHLRAKFHLFPLPDNIVAVAGTATSVAAIKLGLQTFDREKIDGTVVTLEELEKIVDTIYSLSAEEISERFPPIPKGRADILPAGALILLEALRYLRLNKVAVSTRGLRYGIAIEAMRRTRQ